ncbi:MAG: NAD(P)/FAD-dependent oxidoreductase [Bacteroidales bacterium]|nr:NAD(P)/FAD-dependent oxidoreductase [Bacteroidales bacterium]
MRKKIIVIGGGFGGIQLIQHLKEDLYDILLVDKLNHHQFQPLFYQVATSQIEPASISFPLRKIFSGRENVRIRLAEVFSVNTESNYITTNIGDFEFDYLVIATGCKTNFHGNINIMSKAFSLKSTYQAITIRNSILENFEKVLYASEEEKTGLFNIVIVGGGPTGVELSGAFAEIKKYILPKDYPRIDFSRLQIYLLEGSKHTLNSMSETAKKASEKYLKKMGVIVKTGVYVNNYDGKVLTLSNGDEIKSKSVIWAAGVIGNKIGGLPSEIISKSNRIFVDRTNKVKGYENIFAIGDVCYMETPKYPKGHPQVANVAINQGKNLAKNLVKLMQGKEMKEYEYNDMGSMATIGRNKAVVDLPFIRFKGYFAWYVWMFLHLMLILSVRKKLIIFINWAFNYFTKNSSLRLILKDDRQIGRN